MQNIGPNHGVESLRVKLHAMDETPTNAFVIDSVLGEPGKKYPDNSAPNTPAEGTLRKLVANSNELASLSIASRLTALEDAVLRGPFG